MFLLTSPPWWVYSLLVNANYWHGFDGLLRKRIPPLSGFFMSVIYLPFCFLWVDILGSLRARWSYVQSVNPSYPPTCTASTGAVLNRKTKEHES